MKYLLTLLLIFAVFIPPISTPSLVVDMDVGDDVSSLASTSATPSDHALILKICSTVDATLGAHNVPTDDWSNTPAWTELEDNVQGLTITSVAWTTTGASPGAGQVTQTFVELAAGITLAIIEITSVQLRNPIVASNSGGGTSATLEITVSGTLGDNDVMVSGIMSRQDTDGVTPTGNNTAANAGGELDDEVSGGAFSSSGQVQFNTTDLVASWSDIDGSTVEASGVAVHVRGLNNIILLGQNNIKVKVLSYQTWGDFQ